MLSYSVTVIKKELCTAEERFQDFKLICKVKTL